MGWFSFLKQSAASVPTPATGKVAIYADATSGEPSYKGDDGIPHSLVGTGGGGVTSLNSRTGAVSLAQGTNVTLVESPTGTFTINSSGGGGSATLPWKDFVDDYGADPTGVVDCGTAWDAAMADAITNGGLKLMCVGKFLVSRALQNTGAENAQLPLPSVNYVGTDAPITVEIYGKERPNPIFSVIGGQPAPGPDCTVFKSTLSSGAGSVFDAYHGASAIGNISNIHVVLRNFIVQMPDNPTNNGVDLYRCGTCDVDGVLVYTGNMTLASITYPTTSGSYGFRTPQNGNGANTVLGTIDVAGFYNGYSFSEHTVGINVKAWACINPFVFTLADHASAFHRLMAVHCTNGIVAPASGKHVTRILQYDAEHASSGTWVAVSDIKDSANTLYGSLEWRVVDAGVGGATDWNVTGAQNFGYTSHNVIAKVRNVSGTANSFNINDENGLVNCTDTPAMALTIAPESAIPWHVGAVLTAVVTGTGIVTITAGAGVTIQGLNGLANKGQGDVITCRRVGTNTWNVDSTPTASLSNPMTTAGDIIYGGASGLPTRLASGALGYSLVAGSSAPAWADVKGLAQTVANADTSIAAIHRGGMITRSQADSTARTYTIPANSAVPLEVGHITTIVNDGTAGNISIAITTDTLLWSPTLGTGTRVLAIGGIATIVKVSSTRWYISGAGLT